MLENSKNSKFRYGYFSMISKMETDMKSYYNQKEKIRVALFGGVLRPRDLLELDKYYWYSHKLSWNEFFTMIQKIRADEKQDLL